MIYKILLILATGGSLCFASESLTKKAKTNILMPPPLPSHVVLPPVYHTFSQEYQELLTRIMRLPSYPKKRIMSYLLGDGHFLRFISNRIDFPSYVLQHESAVFSADFNRAGDKIVSGSADGSVKVWDLTTGECKVLAGHTGVVYSASFNEAGDKIVSGSEDATVRVWDLTTGECKVLAGHTKGVKTVSFNAIGDKIVSGSRDWTVRTWDILTGECKVLRGHTYDVWEVCFNMAGDKVASASADTTVRVWDLATEDCKVLQHPTEVDAVCFAEGDTQVISIAKDRFRIWNLVTEETIKQSVFWAQGGTDKTSINLAINWAVITPAGSELLVFDFTRDNCAICALYGHTRDASFGKFNKAGDKLVSASFDTTVRVWDFSVFKRFKDSSLIEGVLILKAIYEVFIARDLKERFPEEYLALNQCFPTSNLEEMYFKFSMFGGELKVSLENSYKSLPPEIKQIFDPFIRKE